MTYRVTERDVDFPMGASPEYTVRQGLTLDKANAIAKKLNDKENKENPNSSTYREYIVREEK